MKPANKIKKFPESFKSNIGNDANRYPLADAQQNETLRFLFSVQQELDVMAAYKFAEKIFLSKDIKTFSAEWFEWFIKNLHKIVGSAVCVMNCGGHPSGVYGRRQAFVGKECPTAKDR